MELPASFQPYSMGITGIYVFIVEAVQMALQWQWNIYLMIKILFPRATKTENSLKRLRLEEANNSQATLNR